MSLDTDRLGGEEPIPLSFPQKRIWYLQNLYHDPVMYNVAKCFRINAILDAEALQLTLNALALRHEPLRARLQLAQDGSPFQVIEKNPHITIEYTDLQNAPRDEQEVLARQIIREAVGRPFNLYDELMLRAVTLKLGESESILLMVKHHIINDFTAWRLFMTEFLSVYTACVTKQPLSLPPLPWQYTDFAKRQALSLTKEKAASRQQYWRDFFAGDANPEPATETTARCLPGNGLPAYHSLRQFISADAVCECQGIAKSLDCTLFNIVLTAIALLVSRLYGHSKVMLCMANANRQLPGAGQIVGCFFTNIMISLTIQPDSKLCELIRDVRETFLDARRNQDVPFEMFADDLALDCTRLRKPPYRVYISYRPFPEEVAYSLPDAHLTPMTVSTGRNTHEDIVFNLYETTPQGELCLDIDWLWRTDVFDEKTIKQASSLLETLLGEIRKDIHIPVRNLLDRLADLD